MGDLSGQYIKGTGSHEVKEIAPPTVQGEIIGGIDFTDVSWTVSAEVTVIDANSFSSSTAFRGMKKDFGLTLGKRYKCSIAGSTTLDFGVQDGTAAHIYAQFTTEDFNSTFYFTAAGNSSLYLVIRTINGLVDLSKFTVEEVPEGYPLLDKGDKYLECTANGTGASLPSTQAYGEWEFSFIKGTGEIRWLFITNDAKKNYAGGFSGYMLYITSGEAVSLYRSGTGNQLFITANSYIEVGVSYSIKITRTLDGEFTVYIKGGAFGYGDWTLINATGGAGTNPVTDNTHTTSVYQCWDNDAGDRIANIITRKAVEQ